MAAKIISRSEKTFTIQIEVPYAKSMLQSEETIQVCLNEGGVLATQEARPIVMALPISFSPLVSL